jgi:hypothetical protein
MRAMSTSEADAPTVTALAVFDALCQQRIGDLIDAQLMGELTDQLAAPGRAAELVTRFFAPARSRVLANVMTRTSKLSEAVPAGVLEMLIAMLPSIPPPRRELVEELIGSAAVRAEVRRLMQETFEELINPRSGAKGRPRSVIGWGARAAATATAGVLGAVGGALGADLEGRIGDAVDLGVSMAQRRIVDMVSSAESARRFGKELARLVPKLLETPEREISKLVQRLPLPMLDGLGAAILSHNAARPAVRALVVDEAETLIKILSETTIGELLDRFGAREPLRASVQRTGGAVVAAVSAHLAARAAS